MSKFKLGDRVKYVGNLWRSKFDKCNTGTVIVIDSDVIGIEFDEYINGHNCYGDGERLKEGKPGYCWWVNSDYLEKVKEKYNESIVIYRKGNEVKPNLTPYKRFRSFEEFSNWTGSKFIEVVE